MRRKTYLDEAREKEIANVNQLSIRYMPCAFFMLVGFHQSNGLELLQVTAIVFGFFLTVEGAYFGLDRDGYLASISSWSAWATFGYLWYADHFSSMLLAALIPGITLFIVMQPFVFWCAKKERDLER